MVNSYKDGVGHQCKWIQITDADPRSLYNKDKDYTNTITGYDLASLAEIFRFFSFY